MVSDPYPVGSIWYVPFTPQGGWAMLFRVCAITEGDTRAVEFFLSRGSPISAIAYTVETLRDCHAEPAPPEVWYLAMMRGHWRGE